MKLPDLAGATRIVLVRHTEPDERAHGHCYGSTDVALSAAGRDHAARLGRRLAALPIDLVLSSPRARTRDTATPIAQAHGVPVTTVDSLREMDFGELEGRSYDDIAATMPELWDQWMTAPTTVRFPGGESFADLRVRATAAVDATRRANEGATLVIVTHGGVARSIVAAALGMPDAHIFRLDQRYGSVNVIDWFGETPVIRLING